MLGRHDPDKVAAAQLHEARLALIEHEAAAEDHALAADKHRATCKMLRERIARLSPPQPKEETT